MVVARAWFVRIMYDHLLIGDEAGDSNDIRSAGECAMEAYVVSWCAEQRSKGACLLRYFERLYFRPSRHCVSVSNLAATTSKEQSK